MSQKCKHYICFIEEVSNRTLNPTGPLRCHSPCVCSEQGATELRVVSAEVSAPGNPHSRLTDFSLQTLLPMPFYSGFPDH